MNGEWSIISVIAEQRIAEAQERGEFDDLPGAGHPLLIADMSNVPQELRLAYTILRNSHCLPPELEERKEIQKLADLLENCEDEKERLLQMERLHFLVLQARTRHKRSLLLESQDDYYDRLLARMGSRRALTSSQIKRD